MLDQNSVDDEVALYWAAGVSLRSSDDGSEVWLFSPQGPQRIGSAAAGAMATAVELSLTRSAALAHAAAQVIPQGLEPFAECSEILDSWIARGFVAEGSALVETPIRVGYRDSLLWCAVRLESPDLTLVHIPDGSTADNTVDVMLVEVDDLLDVVEEYSALVHHENIPAVVAAQLTGARPLVSPLLGLGHTCPACLADRVALRRAPDLLAARLVGLARPPQTAITGGAERELLAGALAAKVRRIRNTEPDQELLAIDGPTGLVRRHRVVPVAHCPRCDPGGNSGYLRHLEQSPERDQRPHLAMAGTTGFRTTDPEVTWQTYRHLISDVVGVVPVVEPVGDADLHTYLAGANLVGVDDPAVAQSILRNRGGGKGLTLTAARAGALAEALERESLRMRGDEPLRRATYLEMNDAIHPHSIQLFSDRQMSQARWAQINGQVIANGLHVVPAPFEDAFEADWSPVRSLVDGGVKWVPTSMMYLDRRKRLALEPPACSNGAAAGNTLAEATIQGLLELVERDAMALWWYPRSVRQVIYPLDLDHPSVSAATAAYRKPGVRLWALDLTTDIGIPVFVAISMRDGVPFPMMGAGAHTDPMLALARAISEASQFIATVPWEQATPQTLATMAHRLWNTDQAVESFPWMLGSGNASLPDAPIHHSIGDALDDVVERISRQASDVVWADLTRRDIGMPVVRVFAPGLRHFWRRTAPGRLYEVPVRQGWVSATYDEDGLNPMDLPL